MGSCTKNDYNWVISVAANTLARHAKDHRFESYITHMLPWWNGLHGGLKIHDPSGL